MGALRIVRSKRRETVSKDYRDLFAPLEPKKDVHFAYFVRFVTRKKRV